MHLVDLKFPRKFEPLLNSPAKYKIIHGGRGGGKSWSVARWLLVKGMERPITILCARETQSSMRQSVHKLLAEQIADMGLLGFYDIKQVDITGINGTKFIFAGISDQTAAGIKSLEGAHICWVEEAHMVTDYSWTILLPTLFRKGDPELWITFNPELDTDDTWVRFMEQSPEKSIKCELNWRDNPWFPPDLDEMRLHQKSILPHWEYEWIWEGKCKPAITGAIYADQMAELFAQGHVMDLPVDATLPVYAAMDIGFNDSTAIVVCQRLLSKLFVIDYIEDDHKDEAFYSALLRKRPYKVQGLFLPHDGAHNHFTGPSAERAFQNLGWQITVLPNQPVEDGIRTLRAQFPSLYIDKKCERLVDCLKRYARIIPKTTGEPSKPKHDEFSHGADAMRYTALAMPQMGGSAISEGLRLPPLKYAYSFKGI